MRIAPLLYIPELLPFYSFATNKATPYLYELVSLFYSPINVCILIYHRLRSSIIQSERSYSIGNECNPPLHIELTLEWTTIRLHSSVWHHKREVKWKKGFLQNKISIPFNVLNRSSGILAILLHSASDISLYSVHISIACIQHRIISIFHFIPF